MTTNILPNNIRMGNTTFKIGTSLDVFAGKRSKLHKQCSLNTLLTTNRLNDYTCDGYTHLNVIRKG